MNSTPIIQNHCQFQPLKEIWLGGCYPPNFFDHFDSKTKDIFQHISEITNDDFDQLESIFHKLGVRTQRPKFNSVDDFVDDRDNLLKPPITPCDFALTINDTLYVIPQYYTGIDPFQHVLDDYIKNQQKVTILDRSKNDPLCYLQFASFVAVGKDIYIDYDPNTNTEQYILEIVRWLSQDYRVHVSQTGDHSDGVFCPIKRNHLLTTPYRKNFKKTFPGWDVFYHNHNFKTVKYDTEQKWHIPGIDFLHFNKEILKVAADWIGYVPETVFEINMVVVDEHNIVCCTEDDTMFKYFDSIGVTPHVAKFKSKEFWDAGIHCFTRDIYREGALIDYWPGRGSNGIYQIDEW